MLGARGHAPIVLLCAALFACADPEPRPVGAPAADAPAPFPDAMPELIAQIKTAYKKGDYDRGLALVRHAYELKDAGVSTFDRIGSIYYALGRDGEAVTLWTRALALEHDPQRYLELKRSIAAVRTSLGLPDDAPPPTDAPPKVAPGPARRADPREIDRLYKLGVKYYAEGEYLQATDAFLRVLDLDAANEDARKALERLRQERGGGAR